MEKSTRPYESFTPERQKLIDQRVAEIQHVSNPRTLAVRHDTQAARRIAIAELVESDSQLESLSSSFSGDLVSSYPEPAARRSTDLHMFEALENPLNRFIARSLDATRDRITWGYSVKDGYGKPMTDEKLAFEMLTEDTEVTVIQTVVLNKKQLDEFVQIRQADEDARTRIEVERERRQIAAAREHLAKMSQALDEREAALPQESESSEAVDKSWSVSDLDRNDTLARLG